MRGGRVLDSGTPAELIDRHAHQATVRFRLPEESAPLLGAIRQVTGVQEVEQNGRRVTVRGDRRMIAHVGAAMVRCGQVPDDLGFHVPDLEDALLSLLEHDPASPITAAREPVGGRR